MLNHIWLALIGIGILTATGRDIYDLTTNTYGNDIPWIFDAAITPQPDGTKQQLQLRVSAEQRRMHFPHAVWENDNFSIPATLTHHGRNTFSIVFTLTDDIPDIFREMSDASGSKGTLTGNGYFRTDTQTITVSLDPVKFVYLKRITNAAFDSAGVAVQIALGLIGIMALWLGVMKVAEQAGLIAILAHIVKPVTVRLFPDVPHDHPAIGSMLMNISANMLGLGNAATPFGLKAMEELNSINPKAGVATNAMVTFLALNTSCITLIPATAIALRVAAGSADPAIIIGTTFLASLTATIVAVIVSKLLQRVKLFAWDRVEAS